MVSRARTFRPASETDDSDARATVLHRRDTTPRARCTEAVESTPKRAGAQRNKIAVASDHDWFQSGKSAAVARARAPLAPAISGPFSVRSDGVSATNGQRLEPDTGRPSGALWRGRPGRRHTAAPLADAVIRVGIAVAVEAADAHRGTTH